MAVPLLALTMSSVLFLVAVGEIARSNRLVDRTERVRTEVDRILALLVDAETGVRGFLLTGERRFLEPYESALAELPQHRSALRRLVLLDHDLASRNGALRKLIDRRLSVFREALDSTSAGRTAVLEVGKAIMDQIRGSISEVDGVLATALALAESAEEAAVSRARWAAIGSVLLGLVAGSIGIRVFVGGVARGVRTNTENAERLARGLSLKEPPGGADEIGRSGRALVEASERLTERERAIRDNEQLLALILARIGDGVVVADLQGRFVVFNEAAEWILGVGALDRDPAEWSASYGIMLPNGEPFPTDDLPLARAIRGESVDAVDLIVRNPHRPEPLRISVSGRPLVDEQGTSRGGVVVFRDVSEERERERKLESYRIELERLNRELHALATLDALTELPNRRGFDQLSEPLVTLAVRRAEELSVVFVDLDGLKGVNDRLGHDVGSRMIADAADAIRTVARESDVVARVGGDEFCLLLTGGADAARRVVSRLREHVARFNATSRRPYQVSLSIGCATGRIHDAHAFDDLIREADAAMYADKHERRAARPARTRG